MCVGVGVGVGVVLSGLGVCVCHFTHVASPPHPRLPFPPLLSSSPTLSQVLVEDGAKDIPVILINFLASPAVPVRLRQAGFAEVVLGREHILQ